MNPNSPWHHFKRRLASVARFLHIYLSMFSFAVLLFFAVTGLTLNHAEFFSAAPRTARLQGTIDPAVFKNSKDAAVKDAVAAHFRAAHHITSALSEFRLEESQCQLTFKGPGYVADVEIDRATGKYTATETRLGAVAILNDLHKGRDSGQTWSAIVDGSAILMTLVSATGLILVFFLHKRRVSGLIAIAIGALVCYFVYAIWVS